MFSVAAVATPVGSRGFRASAPGLGKVVTVLYPDPTGGYPPVYVRDRLPKIKSYKDGRTTPTPRKIDFTPGELLGCVSGSLGLRKFVESQGDTFVVTSDKDGDGCEAEKHLADADVVISQPVYPFFITRKRMELAKNLKLAVTAGVGSDHVDIEAACERNVEVSEVTHANSESVAGNTVMMILALVRNYIPAYKQVDKNWSIADCVMRAYDLEGMVVGSIAAGRSGLGVLRRLKSFGCKLHYTDVYRLSQKVEADLGLTFHETAQELVKVCDIVAINCPLTDTTHGLFNKELLYSMKRGAYIVNCARARVCNREDIVEACNSGQLAGYAGDVWGVPPIALDHPWRTMPNHGMQPPISGATLSAQARIASGVREILECYYDGRECRKAYQVVNEGRIAEHGAASLGNLSRN